MLKLIAAGTLLLFCSPALAQTQPAALQQPTASKPKPDNKRIICEDETEIGSRLATKRVCMTAEQWKQSEQDAQDSANQQQRQSYIPE